MDVPQTSCQDWSIVDLSASPCTAWNPVDNLCTCSETVTTVQVNTVLTASETGDDFIAADASLSSLTLTLPTAVGITGHKFTIKKTDSTGNVITVATTGGQTIDGFTTDLISSQYEKYSYISNSLNWLIYAG